MSQLFLRIEGKLDIAKIKEYDINNIFGDVILDENILILLASYSEFTIPVGQNFHYLIIDQKNIPIDSELMKVSIFQKEIDEVPEGHNTVIAVRFPNNCKGVRDLFKTVRQYGENIKDIAYLSTDVIKKLLFDIQPKI